MRMKDVNMAEVLKALDKDSKEPDRTVDAKQHK